MICAYQNDGVAEWSGGREIVEGEVPMPLDVKL
jgi:hypothetical protein